MQNKKESLGSRNNNWLPRLYLDASEAKGARECVRALADETFCRMRPMGNRDKNRLSPKKGSAKNILRILMHELSHLMMIPLLYKVAPDD